MNCSPSLDTASPIPSAPATPPPPAPTPPAHAALREAFHELVMALLGLFEVYQAAPDLVEHTAREVEAILRRHLPMSPRFARSQGKLALERLLDELEAAAPKPEN